MLIFTSPSQLTSIALEDTEASRAVETLLRSWSDQMQKGYVTPLQARAEAVQAG